MEKIGQATFVRPFSAADKKKKKKIMTITKLFVLHANAH